MAGDAGDGRHLTACLYASQIFDHVKVLLIQTHKQDK